MDLLQFLNLRREKGRLQAARCSLIARSHPGAVSRCLTAGSDTYRESIARVCGFARWMLSFSLSVFFSFLALLLLRPDRPPLRVLLSALPPLP